MRVWLHDSKYLKVRTTAFCKAGNMIRIHEMPLKKWLAKPKTCCHKY
jgi:hypothetical protein